MINLFLLNKLTLFIKQILVYCTPTEIQTPIPPSVKACPVQLDDGGILGEWWVSIPLPSVPQTDTLPIELQTPFNIKDPRFRNSTLHVWYVVDPHSYFRVRLRN